MIGFDIWAEHSGSIEELIAQARLAAMNTHLCLVAACVGDKLAETNEGNRFLGLQLRFVARGDDLHITDEAICEVLSKLADRVRWSRLIKLEEFDGVPAFTPLPSL